MQILTLHVFTNWPDHGTRPSHRPRPMRWEGRWVSFLPTTFVPTVARYPRQSANTAETRTTLSLERSARSLSFTRYCTSYRDWQITRWPQSSESTSRSFTVTTNSPVPRSQHRCNVTAAVKVLT